MVEEDTIDGHLGRDSIKSLIDIAFSILVGVSLLGAIGAPISFSAGSFSVELLDEHWLLLGGACLSFWIILFVRSRFGGLYVPSFRPWVFVIPFALLLHSSYLGRSFSFYPNKYVRGDIIFLGLLALLGLRLTKPKELFSWPLLFAVQCCLCLLFLDFADGRLLFSDDHPSFLYRLQLLKEHFPLIPFYNPQWNAGYSAREFFPSGILNAFLLSSPFLYLLPDINSFAGAKFYTLLIPYLFIFIVPWSVYAAGRLLRLEVPVSTIAGILALGPSMTYFEWLLKYGTLGFCVSAGLIPLVLALSIRLAIDKESPNWIHVLLLLIFSFCCLSWTLSFLAFLPVSLWGLIHCQQTFASDRRKFVVSFCLLFLVLNGPWLYTFVRESNVASFVSGDTLPGSHTKKFSAEKSSVQSHSGVLTREYKKFKQLLVKVNPLLLLFFIPAVVVLPKRRGALLFFTVFWLLFLSAAGEYYKPQLELRRMIVPASFLMCLLAAASLSFIINKLLDIFREHRSWSISVSASLGTVYLFGALALTPFVLGAGYLNRSDEKFIFAPEMVRNLSAAIAEFGGEGRTFYLGFLLHELGAQSYKSQDGGHVAPLVNFSGKSQYAFDFYHRRWSSVDPIPAEFRSRGKDGIEEFLDLVNATAVLTYKREWADYCQGDESYKEVFKEGRFRLFTREGSPEGYLLEGRGDLKEGGRSLELRPESKKIVLKYRYLPALRLYPEDAGSLYSREVFTEELGGGKTKKVSFIGLEFSDEFLSSGKSVKIAY